MTKFIAASGTDEISVLLCQACGLEPSDVGRIILDLKAGHAAKIHFELFANRELIDVFRAVELTIEETGQSA